LRWDDALIQKLEVEGGEWRSLASYYILTPD